MKLPSYSEIRTLKKSQSLDALIACLSSYANLQESRSLNPGHLELVKNTKASLKSMDQLDRMDQLEKMRYGYILIGRLNDKISDFIDSISSSSDKYINTVNLCFVYLFPDRRGFNTSIIECGNILREIIELYCKAEDYQYDASIDVLELRKKSGIIPHCIAKFIENLRIHICTLASEKIEKNKSLQAIINDRLELEEAKKEKEIERSVLAGLASQKIDFHSKALLAQDGNNMRPNISLDQRKEELVKPSPVSTFLAESNALTLKGKHDEIKQLVESFEGARELKEFFESMIEKFEFTNSLIEKYYKKFEEKHISGINYPQIEPLSWSKFDKITLLCLKFYFWFEMVFYMTARIEYLESSNLDLIVDTINQVFNTLSLNFINSEIQTLMKDNSLAKSLFSIAESLLSFDESVYLIKPESKKHAFVTKQFLVLKLALYKNMGGRINFEELSIEKLKLIVDFDTNERID